MSTNQPPNPEQQIQQVINDVHKDTAVNTPGAIPLEVAIPGTPNVFKGNTPQEVLDQLVNAQSESFRALQRERAEIQELKSQLTALQSKPQPATDDQAKIQDRYNTWAKNPTEATKQDLADLLGVPADRVVDVMKRAIESNVVNSAATEFLARCPDFPETPENSAMIRNALAQRFGTTMEAATADNLELVYHDLVRNGRMQPKAITATGFAVSNQPLPHIRGGSAPPDPVNDVLANFRNLSLDQMKDAINRLSANVR